MKLKIILSVFLAVLMISLSACIAKPQESLSQSDKAEELDSFTPAEDLGEGSLLANRYNEYLENMSLAFSQSEVTPSTSFEYEIIDGKVRITDFSGNESIVVVPSEIDGKKVAIIGENAFSNKNVRAVSIPDGVEKIEKSAFEDSDGLATLRLPFVGDGEGEYGFGYIFGAKRYDENAVHIPSSLDMVIIGQDCREVADNAFSGCKMLSAICFEGNIEKIGQFAFFECFDLVCISFGRLDGKILEYAFAYCSSLYSIKLDGANEIANGALLSCSSLNSVTLPFVGGNSEKNQYLGYIFGAESPEYNDEFVPSSLRKVDIADGCESVADRAFSSCKYITEINLPKTVNSIGIRAFYACRSLKEIDLRGEVKELGDDAFLGCDSLKKAVLGDNLESIGMQAFYLCSSLEEIDIPQNVSEIKPSSFYGCSALERISFGGVRKIGKDAFGKCTSLIPPDTSKISDIAGGNDALFLSESDTTEKN